MSISCSCMDMWLIFLMLILLTRFSQRGSLMSGGGQWANHVPRGCSRLISISRRWGWARYLPGGWPDGGSWSSGGKWTQRRAAQAHGPKPDLILCPRCAFAQTRSPCQIRCSRAELPTTYRLRNGSLENNVPAKLRCGTCWTNGKK